MRTHTTSSNRRHFLCNLAALPLVGGAVAILGTPTRAAVPTTDAMVSLYGAFCLSETQAVVKHFHDKGFVGARLSEAWGEHGHLFPGADSFVTRVPLLLSAAGVALA